MSQEYPLKHPHTGISLGSKARDLARLGEAVTKSSREQISPEVECKPEPKEVAGQVSGGASSTSVKSKGEARDCRWGRS